jgi:hypothetical protein
MKKIDFEAHFVTNDYVRALRLLHSLLTAHGPPSLLAVDRQIPRSWRRICRSTASELGRHVDFAAALVRA